MTATVIRLPGVPRPIDVDHRAIREAIMQGVFDNICAAADNVRDGYTSVDTLIEIINHSRVYTTAADQYIAEIEERRAARKHANFAGSQNQLNERSGDGT